MKSSTLMIAWSILALLLIIVGGWIFDVAFLHGFGSGMSATVIFMYVIERRSRS